MSSGFPQSGNVPAGPIGGFLTGVVPPGSLDQAATACRRDGGTVSSGIP